MPKLTEAIYEKLKDLARARVNTLITGSHGVGKTMITQQIAKELKISPVKYYSCATLDPWTDFIGVPVPKDGILTFVRPKDLMNAKWIILDEINRAHEKVQNAALELIQFKSINGEKLPNLEMVWALQNPPSKIYHVRELDPAMETRFPARVTLQGNPSSEWLTQRGIDNAVAKALVAWWNEDLSAESLERVPPRVLEQIGLLITKGLDWEFALGDSLGVPLFGLQHRLQEGMSVNKYASVTSKTVRSNLSFYADLASKDQDFMSHAIGLFLKSKPVTCWDMAEVFVALPEEMQMSLLGNTEWTNTMKNSFDKLDPSFHESEDVQKMKALIDSVL